MILRELLLTNIVENLPNENSPHRLEYEIVDLKTCETFYIFDNMGDKPNYRFILNIFLDNASVPDIKNLRCSST